MKSEKKPKNEQNEKCDLANVDKIDKTPDRLNKKTKSKMTTMRNENAFIFYARALK